MSSQEEQEESLTLEAKFLINSVSVVETFVKIIELIKADGKNPGVNPAILNMGKSFMSKHSPISAIEAFINRTHDKWPEVHKNNLDFLREYIMESVFEEFEIAKTLLGGLPDLLDMVIIEEKLATFGNREDIEEELDYVWDLLHGSVKLSIKYIDKKRCPVMVEQADGTMKRKYTAKAFSDISVKKEKELWKIE